VGFWNEEMGVNNRSSVARIGAGLNRIFALDALRGLAAFLVLVRHVPEPYKALDYAAMDNWFVVIFNGIQSIGWIGVDLFFVLSGFLISGLLFREIDSGGRLDVGRFLIRRGFKIWPSYYVAYGGMTLLAGARLLFYGEDGQVSIVAESAVWNALFLQNYVSCVLWPHSWSIAVEEHFYIVLSVVLFFLVAFSTGGAWRRKLVGISLGVVVLTPLWRAGLWGWGADGVLDQRGVLFWKDLYYTSHYRGDSLCVGILCGYLFRYHRAVAERLAGFKTVGMILLSMSFILPGVWVLEDHWFCSGPGFTIIAIGFGWLVLAAAVYPDAGRFMKFGVGKVLGVFAKLGFFSYTVYLAHSVVFGVPGVDWLRRRIIRWVDHHSVDEVVWLIDIGYFWSLSIIFGILLARFVEWPFLRLRTRFYPSPLKKAHT